MLLMVLQGNDADAILAGNALPANLSFADQHPPNSLFEPPSLNT